MIIFVQAPDVQGDGEIIKVIVSRNCVPLALDLEIDSTSTVFPDCDNSLELSRSARLGDLC